MITHNQSRQTPPALSDGADGVRRRMTAYDGVCDGVRRRSTALVVGGDLFKIFNSKSY